MAPKELPTLLPQNRGILHVFDNFGAQTRWAKACFCAVLKHFVDPNKYGLMVETRYAPDYKDPIVDIHFVVRHPSSSHVYGHIACQAGPNHAIIRVYREDEENSHSKPKISFKKEWRRGFKVKRSMARYKPRNSRKRPKWNKFGAHTLHVLGQLYLRDAVQYVMES